MGGANDNAGGLEIIVNTMRAEVAFGGGVGVIVNVNGIVGAGLHAALTADTAIAIKVDDSVLARVERLGWTDLHAGCVGAVVAAHNAKVTGTVRERSLVDVLHPGSELTD